MAGGVRGGARARPALAAPFHELPSAHEESDRMTDSLAAELRAVLQQGEQLIPDGKRELMERAGRELAASGQAARAAGVGDTAPAFRLPSATGEQTALADLLAEGPVVLTFYRGAWCPFCNLALRALQQHHGALTARGARLVAVSPQVPDESLTLAEKEQLEFPVLSDVGSGTAHAYGLAFDLPGYLAEVYEEFGFDLQRVNGGHPRTLPIPACYVIDRAGVIRWAFVDPDYSHRAEPSDILAALDGLA